MREPEYSHAKWEQEWQSAEKLMDNIGRYPKNWWKVIEKQVRYCNTASDYSLGKLLGGKANSLSKSCKWVHKTDFFKKTICINNRST